MIKINVAQIRKRLVSRKKLSYDLEAAELELRPDELDLDGSVSLEGYISNVGDVLVLEAVMTARVRRSCGRCLRDFTADARAEVMEKYFPARAENVGQDAFVYDSDIIDITEPLREGLLLAEPIQALCSLECKGLCSVCGADINDGDCGCDRFSADPRLAALEQFIKK